MKSLMTLVSVVLVKRWGWKAYYYRKWRQGIQTIDLKHFSNKVEKIRVAVDEGMERREDFILTGKRLKHALVPKGKNHSVNRKSQRSERV